VLFRRTRMTGALPRPSRHGNLEALRDLVNVAGDGWDLVRAWLVCALLPHIPVPILTVTGAQGTGKSVLGRTLVRTVDPGPALLRSAPKDLEDWTTTAAGSRVVGLDNVSRIPEWLSDAMCRAVTGEGYAKRALYTDDDLHVLSFRRALLLTSIDPGSMRGDLGERLLPVELRRLGGKRRTEGTLDRLVERQLPAIFGGLLDLMAEVLANPVKLRRLPRMADAAEVMAAVDALLPRSNALGAYRRAQQGVVEQVLEGDPVAAAVLRFMEANGREWRGQPNELLRELARLTPPDARQNWPANARSLSTRLARMEPALRSARGLVIERARGDKRELRLRWLSKARRVR
jgi:hypothetical protein